MTVKSPRPITFVALLRGINVGGNKKVPMAELRALAEELGWTNVATHIQSGNLVFGATGKADALERALEEALEERFGFAVPAIVRTSKQWLACAASSPFPVTEKARPPHLHLGLSKRKPAAGAARALAPYCTQGERIEICGDAIWIDFVAGVGRTKLTSPVLDRAVGSAVTLRNWNTMATLAEMVRAAD